MKKMGLHTEGNWYKGNLHLHSTNSDGRKTPEETAKVYQDHGYHFIAFTEHEHYIWDSELNRDGFLILPGVEFACDNPEPWRIYHLLGIGRHGAGKAPTAENGYYDGQRFPTKEWKGLGTIQSTLDEIRAANNLAVFNHPNWSRLELSDFVDLQGFFAMEIFNYGCERESRTGLSIDYWDSLLRRGRKIWGVATDDAHFAIPDFCGGWVMVNAPELTIEAITDALEEGNFYSSSGPEITRYDVEDGVVRLDCSDAREIHFVTYESFGRSFFAEEGGSLRHGEFQLSGRELYVRAEVVDHSGRTAWTNPIFLKDVDETNERRF